MKTKKLMTIIVLVFLVAFAYASSNIALTTFKLSDEHNAYLGDLTWYKSLDEGLIQAQQEDKPVMVYFWAVWCQFCEKFETETIPNPAVSKVLTEDFVLVAIDLDEDRDTPSKYGVGYPPYELFLDKNGEVIERVPGFVEADRFLIRINAVKEKARGK